MEEDIGAWKQWNLLATSGEMAAFVEVVSNGQVRTSTLVLNKL